MTNTRKERSMARTEMIADPGSHGLTVTREFDAPRELVFRAFTDPELLVQWLGPRDLTMTVERLENRDGGAWRFVHRNAEGTEFGFHGIMHGAPSVEDGAVRTNEFEGMPGHVSLEAVRFEDRGGKTLVRTNVVYQSVEDRDAHIRNGMEWGMNESHQRLDELLALITAGSATFV